MITGSNLCSTVTSITPPPPPGYDDTPPDAMTFAQSVNSTGGLMASTPMMPLHMLINPT